MHSESREFLFSESRALHRIFIRYLHTIVNASHDKRHRTRYGVTTRGSRLSASKAASDSDNEKTQNTFSQLIY